MKKSILAVLLLSATHAIAWAEGGTGGSEKGSGSGAENEVVYFFDDFFMTVPDVILKVGTSFNEEVDTIQREGNPFDVSGEEISRNVNTFTITLQEKECYRHRWCWNPSLIWLFGKERTIDGDLEINIGAGMDVRYKFPKFENDGFYIEAGPYAFILPLNDPDAPKINFHAGLGMEVQHFVVSVDAYANPISLRDDAPLFLLNVGYRFP